MNKRADKKDSILCAGIDVMHGHGYNGTSVKDIVDAAGVPKGSFYNYFESKEVFALEAIEHVAAQRDACVAAVLEDASRPPAERVHALYAGFIEFACGEEFRKGCFLGNLCQEMSDTSEAIREALRAKMRDYSKALAHVIAQAQAEGRMQFAEPPVLAQMICNAWEGALMRTKADNCREPLDAFMLMLERFIQS